MNRVRVRILGDRCFTGLAAATIGLIVLVLAIVLTPMLLRGLSAVAFSGTVEFRKMQYHLFRRGSEAALQQEYLAVMPLRRQVYDLIDRFKQGIDVEGPTARARSLFRDYGDHLRLLDVDTGEYGRRRDEARLVRDELVAAYEAADEAEVKTLLEGVLAREHDPIFVDSPMSELFVIARTYYEILDSIDLTVRDEYQQNLEEVREAVTQLFGPRPENSQPILAQEQFGATRWDMAERQIYRILYDEIWVVAEGSDQLHKRVVNRAETQFQGTPLVPLFGLIERDAGAMLRPRFTFYWQYVMDDSTPGHYFGGVGPEVIGTLMISLLSMLFAIPIGIISAAYLIECAGDNAVIRLIRMCINTLAGVPSIVFGLFGLAFFVQYLLPRLGHKPEPCILTAAMTLAVLVLPVIIRASEEAIKGVPRTYKEASLALGAGRLRTFVKVILPAALPGILTGIILSLSRAAGETAPVLFTGAVALGPVAWRGWSWNGIKEIPFMQTRTLSYGSYDIAVGDRLAMQVPHNQYGMVISLILLVISLNIVAIVIRSRISKKLRGH